MIAINIVDNPKHFDPSQAVFNANPLSGNGLVLLFFGRGQFSPSGFLLGLIGRGLLRFIPLKAEVFPQFTVFGKAIAFLIGGGFVVFLASLSSAQPFDLLGSFLRDDNILDGRALFLATVVLPLPLRLFGPLDGPLGSVNDELQLRTLGQKLFQISRSTGWQLLFIAQSVVQQRGQTMDPLVGLRLAQPKQKAHHFLGGINLEIKQAKDQFIFQGDQGRFASPTPLSLAGATPLGFLFLPGLLLCLSKSTQQVLKSGQGQTGQTLKNSRFIRDFAIVQHLAPSDYLACC